VWMHIHGGVIRICQWEQQMEYFGRLVWAEASQAAALQTDHCLHCSAECTAVPQHTNQHQYCH